VTDGAGGDDWLYGTSVVASNGALHGEIRAHLRMEEPGDEGSGRPPS
jgi:hypothetical protein